MVNPSDRTEHLPGPGKAHRFITQFIMPPAISWATTAERAVYLAGQTVREHPGKSTICALALGFALAAAHAKSRRKLGSSQADILQLVGVVF